MRVSRIEFKGFRRLAATATNFDGPLTAFVGFNEAGKTTILHALAWFTEGGAISPIDYNRSRQPTSDDTPIVKVYFELDDSDRESFAHIAMDNRPTTLVLNRNRDGERYRKLMPRATRPAKPFAETQERLAKSVSRLAHKLAEVALTPLRGHLVREDVRYGTYTSEVHS